MLHFKGIGTGLGNDATQPVLILFLDAVIDHSL